MGAYDIDWENRERVGFWKAFAKTWAKIITSPHDFFEAINTERPSKEPLLFAITCAISTALVGALVGFLGYNFIARLAPKACFVFEFPLLLAVYFLLVLATPLLIVSIAAILHIFVLALGAKADLKTTTAVVAYASATMLFSIIPIAGTSCAYLYATILIILGLKYTTEISTLRAVIAVLLLLFLACLVVCLVFLWIVKNFKILI